MAFRPMVQLARTERPRRPEAARSLAYLVKHGSVHPPKMVQEFAKKGGTAIWDFHVSDKVLSPTIRRAHPQDKHKKA